MDLNQGFEGRTDYDWLSRDPEEVDKYIADPHCGFECFESKNVGKMMSATLNEFDLGPLKNGAMRWRNTAQWARQKMKEEGLLADDSPYGIWEITKRGRAYLREQRKG